MVSMTECPEVAWLDRVGWASGNGGGGFGFRGPASRPGPNVSGSCALETASPRGGSTLYEWVCVDVEGPADMRVGYGSGALSRGGTGRLGGGWYLCVQSAY